MPIKMANTVQSVVIEGYVYVGGGSADLDNDLDSCIVMKLDLQREEWTKLPQYSAKWFAMTSHANQLVLVGGCDSVGNQPTNQTALFTTGRWIFPYPPLTIARWSLTAASFNNYIIVAGGWDGQEYTSSVELLDVEARRWYTAESLPNPRNELKSTVKENTLYLMGGYNPIGYATKVVHKIDLNKLITKAVSKETTPIVWEVTSDTLLKHSVPLSVGGSLLAIGGYDNRINPSSSIHLCQPDTRRWVKVGNLPTACYSCTCSVLPSGDVIVAGGWNRDHVRISANYFLSISNTP